MFVCTPVENQTSCFSWFNSMRSVIRQGVTVTSSNSHCDRILCRFQERKPNHKSFSWNRSRILRTLYPYTMLCRRITLWIFISLHCSYIATVDIPWNSREAMWKILRTVLDFLSITNGYIWSPWKCWAQSTSRFPIKHIHRICSALAGFACTMYKVIAS